MSQKVTTFKQVADAYGVDPRTLRKDMNECDDIWNELEDAGWDGHKLYPIHLEIIERHLGKIDDSNESKDQ